MPSASLYAFLVGKARVSLRATARGARRVLERSGMGFTELLGAPLKSPASLPKTWDQAITNTTRVLGIAAQLSMQRPIFEARSKQHQERVDGTDGQCPP